MLAIISVDAAGNRLLFGLKFSTTHKKEEEVCPQKCQQLPEVGRPRPSVVRPPQDDGKPVYEGRICHLTTRGEAAFIKCKDTEVLYGKDVSPLRLRWRQPRVRHPKMMNQ